MLELSKGLVYLVDCLSTLSRSIEKLCSEIQNTLLPRYLEFFLIKKTVPTSQFLNLTKERTNITHAKAEMLLVLPNKQAIVCKYYIIFFVLPLLKYDVVIFYDIPWRDCELFVAAYAEFLDYKYHLMKLVLKPFTWYIFTPMKLWDFKRSEWLC